MKDFNFYSPTEVIFGKDSELKTVDEIKKHGGSRVLIVYGGGSVVKSGLLLKIENSLREGGLLFTSIGGVCPNPRLSLARKGVDAAKEFKADFILAVGGGSVIDTAKAIAHGAANPETDIWSFWMKEVALVKSMPVGVVLTIAAAGSETSDSAVLTDEVTSSKRGLNSDFNRPRFAIMNPKLLYTLPSFQLSCGIVDIMMHTMDRYFTLTEGNEITDEIAESLLRVVIKNGKIAMEDPHCYHALSEIMWCGSISHNGLTGLGAATDFAPHQLGHELSGKFDVAHGASLSAIWGSWAQHCYQAKPERFTRFAKQVWGIEKSSTQETARAAIDATVEFFAALGMPTCFTELGIGVQSEEILGELADRCVFYGKRKVGSFKKLDREDTYQIYKLANR
ncbi:iron-containing alcohol dehydrogenase [Clostridium lacusfryxellense]|uniref:iron-containing alcohol dehydrogenase n=1 Tax=Clostridium lacusfryxellense TaxID=205328 RepID=UPI001C0C8026|nr:iron-containing alcohol dehydrogenase [Clostridium lacusfryxellense]MBU3111282.1 iron-containing alcohol dehydrogenase [Clostridium lacusfryxellense]